MLKSRTTLLRRTKKRLRKSCSSDGVASNVMRAGKMFGAVHSIVMALANDSGEYFLVSDLQLMTRLPPNDVAFAMRDLLREGLIIATPVPRLYKIKRD